MALFLDNALFVVIKLNKFNTTFKNSPERLVRKVVLSVRAFSIFEKAFYISIIKVYKVL